MNPYVVALILVLASPFLIWLGIFFTALWIGTWQELYAFLKR